MEYEKMPRINYIVGREYKYLINEFQTHEINGVTLMSQDYYILNGERFEVEDNWGINKN